MTATNPNLTAQLKAVLTGEHSHMQFADAVKDFPMDKINLKATNITYSFWHLLEHIRLTQQDIINFCTQKTYVEPKWPEDYWPAKDSKTDATGWKKTIDAIEKG